MFSIPETPIKGSTPRPNQKQCILSFNLLWYLMKIHALFNHALWSRDSDHEKCSIAVAPVTQFTPKSDKRQLMSTTKKTEY